MTNEELDRWLAEEVMGWRILKWHEDSWTGLNGLAAGYSPYEREYGDPDEHWQPTRRIEQAMIVLEKWQTEGWLVEIHHLWGKPWEVYVYKVKRHLLVGDGLGQEDVLAEAICRAVKAAWEKGG